LRKGRGGVGTGGGGGDFALVEGESWDGYEGCYGWATHTLLRIDDVLTKLISI
jgi:hypothetical protein